MKKTFRFISAAVILSTAAVSCQKEPIQETQSPAVEISSVQKVVYSVDGIYYEDMLVGDSALSDLLHRLLEMAEQGNKVTVYGSELSDNTMEKDVVTYSTSDKEKAYLWFEQMCSAGYSVTITYDKDKKEYVCVAII